MAKRKKGQKVYKTLHGKLKIKQQEPYEKPGMNSGSPGGGGGGR